LETNKINLELLNVRTEARTNRTTLENKWQELTALNSNQPLQISSLSEYPLHPLPADYEQLHEEVIASDAALWSLSYESAAARKQISVSKQGWLPKLELGYRRNTESGTPFNGVVVGFSFPIFENRNKVKIAKAQSMNIDFQKRECDFAGRVFISTALSRSSILASFHAGISGSLQLTTRSRIA
jgi:outer membrane protein TolC